MNKQAALIVGGFHLCFVCVISASSDLDTLVSRNATVTGSSEYNELFALSNIVDGNNSTDGDECHCCAATKSEVRPWIRVDLGRLYRIRTVELFPRTERDQYFNGLKIMVHDKLDYSQSSYKLTDTVPSTAHVYYKFTIDNPVVIRYATLKIYSQWEVILAMCEIKIYSADCPSGNFGLHCDRKCGHCLGNMTCHQMTGACSRCAAGYIGDLCNTECKSGTYGLNCSLPCGHCSEKCDASTGRCTGGCLSGYQGHLCNEKCNHGNYGYNCNGTCGHCINDDTCSAKDGTCIGGCAPGFYLSDKTCKTECTNGHYGHNCNRTCGHCINGNTTCSTFDGTCPRGCEPGYIASDTMCKTVLNILQLRDFTLTTRQSSHYGDRDSTKAIDGNRGPDVERCDCCSQTQNAEISWWQVDIGFVVAIKEIVIYGRQEESKYLQLSGFSVYLSTTATFPTTPYRTEPRLISNMTYRIHVDGRYVRYIRIQRPGILTICEVEVFHAESVCPLNTFTLSCLPCGHCKDGAPCDSVTGRCPDGCDPSFSGEICTSSPAASTNTSFIAGAVAGTVAVLVLVGLFVGLFRFFRNRHSCKLPGKSPSDYETAKTVVAKEHNQYDTLDIVDADANRGSSQSYENTAI